MEAETASDMLAVLLLVAEGARNEEKRKKRRKDRGKVIGVTEICTFFTFCKFTIGRDLLCRGKKENKRMSSTPNEEKRLEERVERYGTVL